MIMIIIIIIIKRLMAYKEFQYMISIHQNVYHVRNHPQILMEIFSYTYISIRSIVYVDTKIYIIKRTETSLVAIREYMIIDIVLM